MLLDCHSGRALPTETKVESGTSQSKLGISVDLSNSGILVGTMSHPQRRPSTTERPTRPV